MLRDFLGRVVLPRLLRRPVVVPMEHGESSVQNTTSRVTQPEELATVLRESETPGWGQSRRYLELAEQIEESYFHYYGVISTRKRQVAQIPITVEPADDSKQADEDASLVREFFGRAEIQAELVDVLDAISKAFSVSEINWEHSEKQWMPRSLDFKLPQWFDYDRKTGQRLLLRQYGGETTEGGARELPPFKFLIHHARAKSGLPIRAGLARMAAWAWMGQNFTIQHWLRFVEAYGQPLRVGRYPPGASSSDITELRKAITHLSSDFGAMFPAGMDIELISDKQASGRSDMFKDLARYLNSQVSIGVLGQTLTTEEGDSGSYALGQVHNLVRTDIERADAAQLAATLRRDIAIPIVALNNGPRRDYPRIKIEREQTADVDVISQAVARLMPLGLAVKSDEIYRLLRLSPPDGVSKILEAPAHTNPTLANTLGQASITTDQLDAALRDHLDNDWQRLTEPLINPIISTAHNTHDYQALRTALTSALGSMSVREVTELLSQLSFTAHVSTAGQGLK